MNKKLTVKFTILFWIFLSPFLVFMLKDKCSNSVYHEHKDLLDNHDDIVKQIKKFNASKAKLKNKVDREKEEDPSVEIFTIEDNLKNCEIKLESSSNISCVKMVCRYNSHGFCKHGES